jgi:CDP-glucose 4,6-dehydratase
VGLWQGALENLVSNPDPAFWNGKRVLLTGHTGFKGAWLCLWLQQMGARVSGLSLAPATQPSLFETAQLGAVGDNPVCDIRDAAAVASQVARVQPEVVLHLAAQSLVRAGYRQPLDTFSTNVMGTANLLEALARQHCARVVVVVTTDKVYRNRESPYPYREDDALGGHDPYSASKAAAELVTASYRDCWLADAGVAVATARAGNVIGGGDWSEDRLIPDAVRAWQGGEPLVIRHPEAVRPWQHVLEPLCGYLLLAEKLWQSPERAEAYNFGPETSEVATVRAVIALASQVYGAGEMQLGGVAADPHEANWLSLEVAKARHVLGIKPRWGLTESVRRTMQWYRLRAAGASAGNLCRADIAAFEALR